MFKWWKQKTEERGKFAIYPMIYSGPLSTDHLDKRPHVAPEIERGNTIIGYKLFDGLTIHLLEQIDKETTRVVQQRRLDELGLSADAALNYAIAALTEQVLPRTQLRVTNVDGREVYRNVEGAGSYAASLILCDRFWDDYEFDRDKISVAIPHRNVFVIAPERGTASTRELEGICRLYFDDPEENPKYLLVDGVLLPSGSSPDFWTIVSKLH